MHHANDSASSSKSYVSHIPGAIREFEVEGVGDGVDLGHLLDAPVVAPLPAPSDEAVTPGSKVSDDSRSDSPRKIPKRAAPTKRRVGPKKTSRFGWKKAALLVLLLLGGAAAAYEQTDLVEEAVGRAKSTIGSVTGMFEDKGPPEQVVDDNPLLRQHGARILVASSPPGAKVYLDGKEQGVTPVALTGLMQGDYRVRVESPGFASWATKVQVSHGETAGLNARLLGKQGGAKPGAFGRVNIETTPPADVYMAGDLVGRTPMETLYAPLGRVTLDFELADGRKFSRKVVVESDRVARARFDLTKAKR